MRHFQRKESKDQESIQSNTTPDPGHHKVTKTQENITFMRAKRLALYQQVTHISNQVCMLRYYELAFLIRFTRDTLISHFK